MITAANNAVILSFSEQLNHGDEYFLAAGSATKAAIADKLEALKRNRSASAERRASSASNSDASIVRPPSVGRASSSGSAAGSDRQPLASGGSQAADQRPSSVGRSSARSAVSGDAAMHPSAAPRPSKFFELEQPQIVFNGSGALSKPAAAAAPRGSNGGGFIQRLAARESGGGATAAAAPAVGAQAFRSNDEPASVSMIGDADAAQRSAPTQPGAEKGVAAPQEQHLASGQADALQALAQPSAVPAAAATAAATGAGDKAIGDEGVRNRPAYEPLAAAAAADLRSIGYSGQHGARQVCESFRPERLSTERD